MHPFKIKSGYQFYWHNINALFGNRHFFGWGRKRTGRFASWCAKKFNGEATLIEDGFIRSIGLGVEGAASFSVVKDRQGIYYDATVSNELEQHIIGADFSAEELAQAEAVMAFICKHNISKYNQTPDAPTRFLKSSKLKVLVIAQTAGDASLKYGLANQFTTQDMLQAAIAENPAAEIYIKLHPDVLSGKKQSDIDIHHLPSQCRLVSENYNPLSILKQVDKVYTKTSQMGFEALMLKKPVVCFGMPFYAGWGLTDDRVNIQRRGVKRSLTEVFAAAYLRYSEYFNPLRGMPCDIFEVLHTIVQHRERFISAPEYGYFFGFSRWKHRFVRPFFNEIKPNKLFFINPLLGSHQTLSLKKGLIVNSARAAIYIWGRKEFTEVEALAKHNGIPIFRVEDGFIRSVSLGSDLTQPYSLVVDGRGIYFDPTKTSDLENILQHFDFQSNAHLLEQANHVKQYILNNKLSKYNIYDEVMLDFPDNKKIILVPGQVADDASVKYGAQGMDNLSLLKKVRYKNPQAHIVFKPHPDVMVGNRKGFVEPEVALEYCDQIVTQVSIDSVLGAAHEVHTMTSLVGFEALLRGIKVVTYGVPFYAGWGLTHDVEPCARRARRLTVDELVAATLLLYPRYISPDTLQSCELDKVFMGLESQKLRLKNEPFYALRVAIRNGMIRALLKVFSSKA